MDSSESINHLTFALVGFHKVASHAAEVRRSEKAGAGGRAGELVAAMLTVREALADQGLVITQTFCRGGEVGVPEGYLCTLRTLLAHDSGQWIASEVPILAPWDNAGDVGAAIDRMRGYAYRAILALAAEHDEELASHVAAKASGEAEGDPAPPMTVTRYEAIMILKTLVPVWYIEEYRSSRELPPELDAWSDRQAKEAYRAYLAYCGYDAEAADTEGGR